jgi:CheY-specific phosphatase CheX
MILVFTKELAKKISYILIGEEFESDEELSDMLGEFANIIVGSVKRELKKHEVNINLTLPKLFNDIENLKKLVYKRKGVEVKFYFKNEEFYFYLIR